MTSQKYISIFKGGNTKEFVGADHGPASLSPERYTRIISIDFLSYSSDLRTVEHADAFVQIKIKFPKPPVATILSLDV